MVIQDLRIAFDGLALDGTLALPQHPLGLVVFAHGSGSNRRSPRNWHVAHALHGRGIATLLFDLLTAEEAEIDAHDATLRFDVQMLGERLLEATDSIVATGESRGLPLGYFGGSTGAAAALHAAARRPGRIAAIVARGGRPDLAGAALSTVTAPTLLIVGGHDTAVLAANREAARLLPAARLEVIPDATHLFPEPGALDEVARLAGAWFAEHFLAARHHGAPSQVGAAS